MWAAEDKHGATFQVNTTDIRDWAEITEDDNHYVVFPRTDPAEIVGEMRFIEDFPDQGVITIGLLVVEPDYRNRGVATALLARLHANFPDHKISPGAPPADGISYITHILETEPVVREAGALLSPLVQDL